MSRITSNDVEQAFKVFCTAMGAVENKWSPKADGSSGLEPIHGSYVLNHDGCGWQVTVISDHSGGERQPFGCDRITTREMFDCLRFAADAVWEFKRVNELFEQETTA